MSLALLCAGNSFEFRWRRWALLRDCVACHLEGGNAGSHYPVLASLGDALVHGSIEVDPQELERELVTIRERLRKLGVEQLMLGKDTAVVLYVGVPVGAPRRLTLVEKRSIPGDAPARDLAEYFSVFLDSVLGICGRAKELGRQVEVVDL